MSHTEPKAQMNNTVRFATLSDVSAILDIYNEAVINSTATYDLAPVSLESRLAWFEEKTAQGWPIWVAVQSDLIKSDLVQSDLVQSDLVQSDLVQSDLANGGGKGKVIGWATYGPYRPKAGYDYTAEHSVYVHHEHRGEGIGHLLMQELIKNAKDRGLHMLIGVVDAENAASIGFHEGFGFVKAGHLKQVGRKFDRWLDAAFLQLLL